jgi:multiple sugar transport system permease protein
MQKSLSEKVSVSILIAPYFLLFLFFIALPVISAVVLSFTYFNTMNTPQFIALSNYIYLFTNDTVFMQYVLPNTIVYAVFVGGIGYILAFFLAWSLSQITRVPRTIMAIIIYSPSMTGGVLLSTVWKVIFNGERNGYLNYIMIRFGIIDQPVQWLQSSKYLMPIMIIVSLWSSMGVGFLAILAGILNVDHEQYEAAYIDGVSNRFQEIFYVTIPNAKPQMLFGAVMAVVNTFQSSGVGVALSGSNPTPNYSGQLIVTHIEDFGFIRYEMGYAAAISVVLLVGVRLLSSGANRLFGEN